MRKFSYVILTTALAAVVVYLCSCAGGGVTDPTDPILPSLDIKEGVVDPITRDITITKEDITVTVQHWSRSRLNRKYTTVDMRSPFYYTEGWKQAFQAEAFYVTIKNDTPKNVIVNLNETTMQDDRDYVFRPKTLDELRYTFVTKKLMDLRTKQGLEMAQQSLLNEMLGQKGQVEPGQTVSGFLSFSTPTMIVTKLWVNLVLEKEPEVATMAYKRVEFRFDYTQDPVLRAKQPTIKR